MPRKFIQGFQILALIVGPVCSPLILAAEQTSSNDAVEEIAVVAPRLDTSPLADLVPQISFDRIAIDALGTSNLDELLSELQIDLDSGRGRGGGGPVVLINGLVVSSFGDVRNYPTEAVDRIEIFPEQVALRYGFRATQKVINFVLHRQFAGLAGRASSGASVAGGGESSRLESGYLKIDEDRRFNVNLDLVRNSALHDSDRTVTAAADGQPFSFAGNVFGAAAGEIDPTLSSLAGELVSATTLPDNVSMPVLSDLVVNANQPSVVNELDERTLIPQSQTTAFSVSYAQPLTESITGLFSAGYTRADTIAEQGLAGLSFDLPSTNPLSLFTNDVTINLTLPFTLQRQQVQDTYEASASIAGRLGAWTWSWLSSFNQSQRDVETDREALAPDFIEAIAQGDVSVNPYAPPATVLLSTDTDMTDNRDLTSRLLFNGILTDIPSGPIRASFSGQWRRLQRDNETQTGGVVTGINLQRQVSELDLSLDVPLVNKERWGRLSINTNAEVARFSDFGTLSVLGTGLSWRPSERLRVNASFSREEGAPGIAQLGDAVSRIPNRRVFDFLTGNSVNSTLVTGGNPQLDADVRRISSLGLRLRPIKGKRLTLILDYLDSQTDKPIVGFPIPNAQIEAAFPERFIRDDTGTLVEFDTRPINVQSEQRRELRWGFRHSATLFGKRRNAEAKGSQSVADGARSKNGRETARLRLALIHTYVLQDDLDIAPGVDVVDFVGISNAGRLRDGAEHDVNFRGTFAFRQFSARLNLNWRSATGTLAGPAGALRYDDLTRADLNLLYTFKPGSGLAQRLPWLTNARVKLTIDNLFNARPDVVDPLGSRVAGFSADELDPLGRAVYVEVRKLFAQSNT